MKKNTCSNMKLVQEHLYKYRNKLGNTCNDAITNFKLCLHTPPLRDLSATDSVANDEIKAINFMHLFGQIIIADRLQLYYDRSLPLCKTFEVNYYKLSESKMLCIKHTVSVSGHLHPA